VLNSTTKTPKISCLLVTAGGRFEYFKRSVTCYVDQTYPNRELLILNEGPKEYQDQITDYVVSLGRSDIRTVFLNGYYTLGALRNISVALANGEIWTQWDDDDFNVPHRLATQYSFLSNNHIRVSYLSDQLHYYFHTKELYWEDWKRYLSGGKIGYALIPGTIMAYKEGLAGRYPSSGAKCKTGEDSVFSNYLLKKGVSIDVLSGRGCMHVYSYHGQNVFDLEHHAVLSRIRSHDRRIMLKHRREICRSLDYLQFEGTTRVMGRDGLAFTHTWGD